MKSLTLLIVLLASNAFADGKRDIVSCTGYIRLNGQQTDISETLDLSIKRDLSNDHLFWTNGRIIKQVNPRGSQITLTIFRNPKNRQLVVTSQNLLARDEYGNHKTNTVRSMGDDNAKIAGLFVEGGDVSVTMHYTQLIKCIAVKK